MYTAPLHRIALLFLFAGAASAQPEKSNTDTPIHRAFNRLYNFDFAGAHGILDKAIAAEPQAPLPWSVKAAAYVFAELNRLRILEIDFFLDDDRVVDRRKLAADPAVRDTFFRAVRTAERLANARLAGKPDDPEALFALCMAAGVVMDYATMVERRRFGSLPLARRTHSYARKLLALNPPVYDAHMTYGTIEYVVGSMPFFLRWFVRFDQIKGSKQKGIEELELVARRGTYYGPFARILLAVIHTREKRPEMAEKLLEGLVSEFPENPLLRKELLRIRKLAHPERPAPRK